MKQPHCSETQQQSPPSTPARSAPSPRFKRRNKTPKLALQLRLLWPLVGLFVLILLVQALALGAELSNFTSQLPSDGPQVAAAVPGLLFKCVLFSLGLLLPAVLLIGVHTTFRIAGPLYRFERHLEAIARGEWPEACRIRRKDELQDFCVLLNDALQSARDQGAAESDRRERETERAA